MSKIISLDIEKDGEIKEFLIDQVFEEINPSKTIINADDLLVNLIAQNWENYNERQVVFTNQIPESDSDFIICVDGEIQYYDITLYRVIYIEREHIVVAT